MRGEDDAPRRDVIIQAEVARATVAMHAPTVKTSTPFWLYWLDIAIEQLEAAARARSLGVEARAEGRHAGDAMVAETRAAMIAAVASAACVESFYKTVASLTAYDPTKSGPAAKAAFTVLSRSFDIEAAGLQDRLKTLFDDRNTAIHSAETDDPTEPHPLWVSTGKGNAFFTMERAAEAVALAAGPLEECLGAVRPTEEFAQLANRMEGQAGPVRERAARARALANHPNGPAPGDGTVPRTEGGVS